MATQGDAANQLNPNELNERFVSMGISKLDASLLVNCIMHRKSYSWLNNDPIPHELTARVNSLLRERGLGASVEITDAGSRGKIWEVNFQREYAAPPLPEKPFAFGFGIP